MRPPLREGLLTGQGQLTRPWIGYFEALPTGASGGLVKRNREISVDTGGINSAHLSEACVIKGKIAAGAIDLPSQFAAGVVDGVAVAAGAVREYHVNWATHLLY